MGLVVSKEIAAALEDIVPPSLTAIYGAQGDLFAMAAHLYEALRYFDDKRGGSAGRAGFGHYEPVAKSQRRPLHRGVERCVWPEVPPAQICFSLFLIV